ncbi:MAG: alanine racemase [Oscillospiraceae bacterium]|jgi:alanine racemase|nr:alanine racemase [Oscillospiraceae bacterium]
MFFHSKFTVDLTAIAQNAVNAARALGGTAIIPVLKGNAYGHGAAEVLRALDGAIPFDCIAVAHVSEAAELRNAGCEKKIMLVSAAPRGLIPDALALGVILPVGDVDTVAAIARAAEKPTAVQIKINSGLNRFGASAGAELDAVIRAVKAQPKLKITGAYTHFSLLDKIDESTARQQLSAYLNGVAQIEAAGIAVPLRHAAASNVSEWFPSANLDAVRLGRRLFMGPPPGGAPDDGSVTEPGTWASSVTAVRTLERGERFGYGGSFTAENRMKIAVAAAGYGDGLSEAVCAAGAPVLVDGRRARLLAAFMDSCLIDVTDCDCRLGSEVVFFGRAADGAFLSAREVAAAIGEEGVLLTSRLSARVEHKYV